MASPVDTSVKFITSQMAGAPPLSGTAGALIALLDAFLKDGFDIKQLTSLTVASGVATAAYAGAHSAQQDAVVLISGVTGGPAGYAGLNGEQKITGKATNGASVTFATTLPDGTYTGNLSMKMAPLGWLKAFSGVNKAAYKSADLTSSGCLLRVDDTGTTFARVTGYEAMSDVDTGSGPFPTPAQIAGGGYWAKAYQANTSPTQWLLVGDGKFFLFLNAAASSFSAAYSAAIARGFGDPITLKPAGDPYACLLNCSAINSADNQMEGALDRPSSEAARTYSARPWSGLGGALAQYAAPLLGGVNAGSGNDTLLGVFPSEQVDGALRMSRRYIASSAFRGMRAIAPGIQHVPQSGLAASFANFDRFTSDTGRRFICMVNHSGTYFTQSVPTGTTPVDVSGPWR